MKTPIQSSGEAMPRNNAILQCTDDVALAKSIVSSVWLALASQNFTEEDVDDLRETLYGAVLKLHSASKTLSGSTPADISAALDIEAPYPQAPAVRVDLETPINDAIRMASILVNLLEQSFASQGAVQDYRLTRDQTENLMFSGYQISERLRVLLRTWEATL